AMSSSHDDEILFGWDPTPGIVSVWADQDGDGIVWRRVEGALVRERVRFHPWLLSTHLEDVAQALSMVRYRELDGEVGSYRYLLTARSGRALTRLILESASRRLKRPVQALAELEDYYRVGPVEQYLMQTGRAFFRGLSYGDIHRMEIDLETTSLDPATGRIFL